MALYIATYDLHNDKNYAPLWELMKRWGATRSTESVWLLNVNLTAGQVRDAMRDAVHEHDSVVVVEIKQGSYWACYRSPDATDWLRRYVMA